MQVLSLRNIYKEFPGIIANNKISIDFRCKEVHALLGENGAGKTTLMNIIYGIYKADSGDIIIDGKKVDIKNPKDAIQNGIGMVHQHFMLVQNHTVSENICLGLHKAPNINPGKKFAKEIQNISEKYGLKVNPDYKIWQLSAGEQQRVEIIKALIRGAEFLILDEPTSVLTPQEVEGLFKTISMLIKNGIGVIFISHKLDEVFAISDKITVLREGRVIDSLKPSETDKVSLAKLMVGREISFNYIKNKVINEKDALTVDNLWVKGDKGVYSIKNVSFKLLQGEILGVAGVSGNGQKELVEVLTGLRKSEKGDIKVFGNSIIKKSAKEIANLKVAHIPEERLRFGSVPNFPVYENLLLKDDIRSRFLKKGLIQYSQVKKLTKELVKQYNVSASSIEYPIKQLSGGNIQKFICARELESEPKIIIAAHPTYGLDIAATDFIRKLLLKKKDQGCSILLVSEDLEEILSISDRVIVMFSGEISGNFIPEKIKLEEIGMMMAGLKIVNKL